ncbi:MAG: hypothetical protein OJF47_002501 [Nitrospira sp.]|nr:MAG: hypothetical protein OJF47_002501 [Nitrospira sp.]
MYPFPSWTGTAVASFNGIQQCGADEISANGSGTLAAWCGAGLLPSVVSHPPTACHGLLDRAHPALI